MKNRNLTVRQIVRFLNNPEEDGGFWLPNIQRPFVWSEDQICRLFDSILREYPISTLLIWKTRSNIRHRKFVDNWNNKIQLSNFYVPENERIKSLVLDGQQRIQSLYIGLCGSYESKELCFDILSGELNEPDDIKFKFKFINQNDISFPWIKFKELIFDECRPRAFIDKIKNNTQRKFNDNDLDKMEDNINIIDRTFKMNEAITYQELDSIDNPKLYTEDDVVEVFIRANSGGTKLGKSDLLFSLLNANWTFAGDKMEDILSSLNKDGFNFNIDFVLKTCLVLLDQGARYEVSKFRKNGIREDIENRWDEISSAIKDVLDFIRGKTFIKSQKSLTSNLVLIPLIYVRFHFNKKWKEASNIDLYLLRCLLSGSFSGHSDNLIDGLVKKFKEIGSFNIDEAFNIIRSQNKSLELTEDRLLNIGYGNDSINILFNIWYRDFNHTPAYENNLPQIDHIFPQSSLRNVRVQSKETGRMIMKYHDHERNQLANCMLLSREENGNGGKGSITPEEWFSNKDNKYLEKHLIPLDKNLWKIEQFDNFIEARKKLIKDRFRNILFHDNTGTHTT